MPPKPDPTEVKYVYLRQVGGEAGATAVLGQRLGPLGIPPKKVGEDIMKGTQEWKGVKIMVKLTIQNRQAAVDVIPTATSLLIKELREPPRDRKKVKNIKHNGNLPLGTIVQVARTMRTSSRGIPARQFKGTVKEILGTCNAIGCTVDGQNPRKLQQMVDDGEVEVPEE